MKKPISIKQKIIKRRRGSTIVEFALVVPVLLAMLLGIIEFGWMIKNQLTIANAAREGARAAALGKNTTAINARIQDMTATMPGSPGNLTITKQKDNGIDSDGYAYTTTLGDAACGTNTCNDAATGTMIRVRVSAPNQPLTGFFPFMNRTLQVDVMMRRE
jgi:Flp pilus assembly protein TadG